MSEEGQEPTGGEPEGNEPEGQDPPTPGDAGPDIEALRQQLDKAEKARKAAEAQARSERQKRQEWEQQYQRTQDTDTPDFDPYDQSAIDRLVEQKLTTREVQKQHQAFMSIRPPDVTDDHFQTVGTSITPEVAEVIKGHPEGWGIIKHLAEHPEALSRIQGKSGAAAAFELGQVVKEMKPPEKQTSAPDPINPVSGSTEPGEPGENASQEQYEAWMRKKRGGSVFPRSQ